MIDLLALKDLDLPETVTIKTAKGKIEILVRPLSEGEVARLIGGCPLPAPPPHKSKPNEVDRDDPDFLAKLELAISRRRLALVAAAVDHKTADGRLWTSLQQSRANVSSYLDVACAELDVVNKGVIEKIYNRIGESVQVVFPQLEAALKNS